MFLCKINIYLIIGLLTAFFISTSQASEQTVWRLADDKFEIQIQEFDKDCNYSVTINGKDVISTHCEGDRHSPLNVAPKPNTLQVVKPWTESEYSTVIVFQHIFSGNACDQGPIWFLSIKPDGTWTKSEPLGLCKGEITELSAAQTSITFTISRADSLGKNKKRMTYKYIYGDRDIRGA